jgi:class 3 adenylate cyclase
VRATDFMMVFLILSSVTQVAQGFSMPKTVFFADVLGFSSLSKTPGASGAADALSDLAHLLSSEDELVQLLQSSVWTERYGLSDSIFLIAEDSVQACAAAAEFFFDLAYVNHEAEAPVLLRGSIAIGESLRVKPIFPESAKANLAGEAVVRAVRLEAGGPKGPRLLLSEETAKAWEESSQPESWLLSRNQEGQAELLWLLPSDPTLANGLQIGEVCRTALRLALEHGPNPAFGYHYLGYLDLVIRSLERLLALQPKEAATAISISELEQAVPRFEILLAASESVLLERLRALIQ